MAEDSIRTAFNSWDKNGDGYVECSEIAEVLKACGHSKEDAEVMAGNIVNSADADKDGKVTFEEYKTAYLASQK